VASSEIVRAFNRMANDTENRDQQTTPRKADGDTDSGTTINSENYLHSGLLDTRDQHLDKAHDYHLTQDKGLSSEQVNSNLHLGSHEGDANIAEESGQAPQAFDLAKDTPVDLSVDSQANSGSADGFAQTAASLSGAALAPDLHERENNAGPSPSNSGTGSQRSEIDPRPVQTEATNPQPETNGTQADTPAPSSQSAASQTSEVETDTVGSGLTAISDTDVDENAVDEDAEVGDATGITANAGVADGASVTYSLLNDADGLFSIDPVTGIVSVAGELDAETAGTHNIVVLATASDGETRTETFTIAVNDVDEGDVSPVTDIDASEDVIAENATQGTTVGITAQATDPDVTATVRYQVDDPRFEIDNDGVVTVAEGATFDADTEGDVSFTVTAISSDGSTSSQMFNLSVSDINEHSVSDVSDIDTAENAVAENAVAGDEVGITAFAEDSDISDAVTYSVSDDRFVVSGDGTVTIADGAVFDAETESSIDLTVTALSSDGSNSSETFSIDVANVIDEAPSDIGVAGGAVDENSAAGTVVATLSTTDKDADDNHTYEITEDPSGFFEIVGNEIRVKHGADLDHETAGEHIVTIEVQDAAGLTYSEAVTLTVNDVNEAPAALILDPEHAADFTAAQDYVSRTSISDMGLESKSNVFSMSFTTASDVTTPQTLFETGGNVYGLNVVIEDGRLNIYAGNGNDLELSAEISPETDYNFALELNKDSDTLTLLMSDELPLHEMNVSNSLADQQTGWTDSDWDGGNHIGVGTIGGRSSQGNTGGDFLGTINGDGLSVYADAALDDYLQPAVDENSAAGTVVATLSTTDEDDGDSHTYEITDDPSGYFEIFGNEIRVKDGAALDHEDADEHVVTIQVKDADGLTYSEAVTIAVKDVNEAPTALTLNVDNRADFVAADGYISAASISDMGLETDSNVFTMSFTTASDVTTAQTLFETGGGGRGLNVVIEDGRINVYAGNGNDLELSADILADTEYNIALELNKDTDTISLLMSGVLALDEMNDSNSLVAQQIGWTDSDWDGGNHIGVGTIGGGSSQGRTGGDFLGTIHGEGLSVYADATLADYQSVVLSENSAGAIVGALSITDPDAGDTHSYFVSDDRFQIVNGMLRLKAGESIDFETEPSVDVIVTATDSGGRAISETFTVTFDDVAENLQLDDGGVVFTDTGVSETSITGGSGDDTIVAHEDGGEIDGGEGNDTLVSGAGDDELDGGSGNDTASFSGNRDDYDVVENPDSSFTVTDTRPGSPDGTDTVRNAENFRFLDGDILAGDLVVQDINNLTDTDSASNTIVENASAGTTVGITAHAEDVNVSDTVTYLVDDDRFEIAADGTVTVAAGAVFDAETEGTVDVTVTAESTDGSTSEETFTINVSDVDEEDVSAVSDTDAADNTIAENATAGAATGITASASDGDVTDTVTYSVDDDRFEVAADGTVSVASGAVFDAETEGTVDVTVTAESTDGSTSEETFTISVSDVDEEDVSALTDADATDNTIAENATAGAATGITASASDGDVTDTVTYSVDDDRFEVAADGTVTVASGAVFDAETEGTVDVTVTAESTDGSTSEETFTISVSDVDEEDVSAVTDTDTADNTIAENATAGAATGITASASDGDVTDTVTYSVDDDRFEVAADGTVTVASGAVFDAETEGTVDVTVTAESTDGSTSEETFTISVSDVDEEDVSAVSDTDGAANTIAENATAGAATGITASASDGDVTDTVTYSVDDDRFEVAADGTVTVASDAVFDAETEGTVDVTVTAESTDGSTSEETFTISVSDVDEEDVSAVSDKDAADNTIAENATAGAATGIIASATDGDVTDTVTYSVDDDRFEVAADGTVTVASGAVFDAETEVTVDVTVTAESTDGSTSEETFTISVSDVDEEDVSAVTDADGAANTIAENATAGAATGITASAADGDVTDTVTYSVDDDRFEVAADGTVTVADGAAFDAETEGTVDVTVTAESTDGSTSEETLTISVSDVDEEDVSAVTDTDAADNTIAENATAGAATGITASASDGDVTDTVTYSVDDDRFEVAADGTVTVASDAVFDAETEGSIDVTVTVSSTDGSTSQETFTITVSDVNEFIISDVSDTNLNANTIAENAAEGTEVGVTVVASDDDVSDSVSYSVDDDRFDVADDGTVTVATGAAFDAETEGSIDVTVTAESTDGSTSQETFTINVSDADEEDVSAVTDSDTAANTIAENATAGAATGITASATDGDVSDTVTYSIDDNRFEVAADGTVTVATGATFDAETEGTVDVTVTAESTDGSTSEETFTISVSDVDEEDTSAVTDTDAAANSIAENAAAGTAVGITASASDGDATDTVTYSVDDDRFDVEADGTVTVAAGAAFDYETEPTVSLTVTATSTDGSTSQETFTISVADVVEDLELADTGVTMTDTGVAETTITGGSGNDAITAHTDGGDLDGGDGTDTLMGSTGDDTLDGGAGTDNDTMMGGEGSDTYLLRGDGRADIISDTGTSGTDRLVLSADTGTEFELENTFNAATQGIEEIDGSAVSGETLRAQRSDVDLDWDFTGVTLNGVDKIEGRDGDDSITGSAGDDNIVGGAGSDTLAGSGGDDTIDGGEGTDTATYSGNLSDYTITEDSGTYTIVDNRAGSPDGTDTVTNVENFTFADGTVAAADLLNDAPTDLSFSANENLSLTETGGGNAVVTGEIVDGGSGTRSVDHWSISHEGGDLTIDVLANGFNSGSLDSQIYLYKDNGGGSFTLVSSNDDGARGSDSSTSSYDSYISESGLEAGDYMIVIGSWRLSDSESLETSGDYPATGSTSGPYQITITGETSVTGMTQNPVSGGNWGDPGNNAVIVSDGVSESTLAADSVVAGIATVVDSDAGDTFNFSFTDDGDGAFQIDTNTGDISLAAEHDASTALSDTVTVQVTDSDNQTYEETVGIELGTSGSDTINGTANEDVIYGFGGNDTIDGGAGSDTMVLSGAQSDYNFYDNGDGSYTVIDTRTGSPDGTKTVSNVENYSFADGDVASGDLTMSTDMMLSDANTSRNTIHEVADVGTEVGISVSAMNPGGGDVTYTLDDDRFSIDSDGVVTIASHSFFDSQVENSIDLTVTATSSGGGEVSETFSISVTGNYDYEMTGGTASGSFSGSGQSFSVDGIGGNDTIETGEFSDRVEGGAIAGADTITGNGGRDLLFGEGGQDTISGGSGDDIIIGGADDDTLYGGDGSDLFMHGLGDGNDDIFGGTGGGWTDVIDLGGGPGVTSAGEYGTDWTVTITSGSIENTDTENGRLELSDDAVGSIDFTDGTKVDFAQIEEIRW